MRRRKRYTVQYRPTGACKTMMRGMGVIHTIFGTVFAIIAVTEIVPAAGPVGLLFLAVGVFFAVNGALIALGKDGLTGRRYQIETETEEGFEEDEAVIPDRPAVAQPSVASRLKQLEDLREKRLITANEFEEKRKEILKEL